VIRHVAIVGAGFSGTLLAVNLLRHDGPSAVLVERTAEAGKGLAYGAAHPSHLLNVRAANMSAFPDDPGHFVRWLERCGLEGGAGAFVPRVTYGVYLAELLEEARERAGERLTVVRGDVVNLSDSEDGVSLRMADGRMLAADAAVLAVGNLPPHTPPGLNPDALPSDCYKGDPWAEDVAAGLGPDDTVLAIGTGLTAVDVALMLDARGFAGRIVALSRRGLLPRRHAAGGSPADKLAERPATVASALVQAVRARGDAIGWRAAVDELRPFTQAMWANATEAERGRFLRHLRPWWDVHRHRLAPSVADRLAAMTAAGRLSVLAGKTLVAAACDGGVELTWRPRGTPEPERLVVQRIVNCTGPQGDLGRTTEPLLAVLAARGRLRADAARLGIDVDANARAIDAEGAVNERLFALGPMTRGAFWEIVAVPDIRAQSWTLARRLSNAHWVGGEGL
jgi:uncharacterized NAD(P)/FAD-binding protein YdhS